VPVRYSKSPPSTNGNRAALNATMDEGFIATTPVWNYSRSHGTPPINLRFQASSEWDVRLHQAGQWLAAGFHDREEILSRQID